MRVLADPSSTVKPSWSMAAGALAISTSAIFTDLAGTSPGTTTFFRCALAVPLLLPLAAWERRRQAPPTRRQIVYAVMAGAFFAADSLWWTEAIGEIGAGLSTVLVNAQVLLVPLLALGLDREPISRRFLAMLPLMVAGIVLTGGVLEAGAAGSDAVAGTVHATLAALCYSGFLYLLRRGGGRGQVVQSYLVVVVAAAVVAVTAGQVWGTFTFAPELEALAWLALIAAAGQVTGWLLVAIATPHLRPEVGASAPAPSSSPDASWCWPVRTAPRSGVAIAESANLRTQGRSVATLKGEAR
jgi:drug/metabolite transporter (DMT)-like permease